MTLLPLSANDIPRGIASSTLSSHKSEIPPKFEVSKHPTFISRGRGFTVIELIHLDDAMMTGHSEAMLYRIETKTLHTIASWKCPGVRHLDKILLISLSFC